jgi:hypothetical protein
MPFTTTPIRDNFDRVENPLISPWVDINGIFGAGGMQANGASAQSTDAAARRGSALGSFGHDCEVYATALALPTNNTDRMDLFLGLQTIGAGTTDGYQLRFVFNSGAGDTWGIYRVDNDAGTLLGSTTVNNMAAGSKMGFERIGSTLSAYKFSGGVWTLVVSQTDSTYTGLGAIGMATQTAGRFDDFGGGTLVGPAISADYRRFRKRNQGVI